MAGIFANVDSDIKKLQHLRQEIENIKKELKGINVKVDIDIAKGLEAQLKGLTDQYNALAEKVADTEARIATSASRITDASKKIIQAQEQLAKASTPTGTALSVTSNSKPNTAETASVKEQAKAYDELREEIDKVLGSREANIKRLIEEQNAIRLINEELKALNKTQGSKGASANVQQRIVQLNNDLLTHKAAVSELRQSLNNSAKLDNAAATSMDALSQSLGRMRTLYRQLTDEERNAPFGKELLASINQADAKIKQLDATIGNHQRNVGNYASGWNGLSMSIQQIGRELPSLAVGWSTFFLAISNNLPILADEIKRARVEYDNMKKSGKTAIPVWKQIVSSLLSWQTALTVGITLLTLYGEELVEWASSLIKGKKALSETYQATKEFQESVSESAGAMIAKLEKLSAGWVKLGGNIEAQKKYIIENKQAFDETGAVIRNVADAENLLVKNKNAFILSIIEKAKAAATMKIASEQYEKSVKKMMEAEKMSDTTTQFVQTSSFGTGYYVKGENEAKKQKKEEAKKEFEEGTKIVQQYAKLSENERKILEESGIKTTQTLVENSINAIKASIAMKQEALNDLDVSSPEFKELQSKIKAEQAKLDAITGTAKKDNSITEQQNRVAKLIRENALSRISMEIDLENQVAQSRIDAMQDGYEKEQAQRELNDKKELQAISKQKQEYVKKVIDMEEEMFNAREKAKQADNKDYRIKTFDRSSVSVDTSMFDMMAESTIQKQLNENAEYYKKLLSQYQDYISKRLEAQKKFDKDLEALEKAGASKEQISELEYQREETYKSIDSEFAMREESFQSWMDSIADLSLKKLREQLMLAEEELQRMELGNPNDPNLAVQRAKVANLKGSISNKQSVSPDKRSIKDWQDLYNVLQKVDKEFAEIGDTVGGSAGEIIKSAGSITTSTLQMVDSIINLSDESAWAVTGTATAAAKAIKIVENASVILTVVSGALSIATKIANLFSGKSSYEEYQEAKEVYDSYISTLDKVIEKQLELAESLSGQNAHAAYQEAVELYQTQMEAARVLGKQYLNSREKREHSKGYKEVEDMSSEGWTQAANAMGMTVDKFRELMGGRMTGLFDLTEEDLMKLQKEAPIFWAQLDEDTRSYANQIVDGVKDVTDVLEQEMENLTGISFDSFSDGILESLYDVEATAEDISDDMADYMRKALIKAMYVKNYEPQMRKWYEQWAKYMEDGEIDENEQKALDDLKNSIIEGAKSAADAINEQWGTSSSSSSGQTASSGGFQTMSQDSADELNGRFTALQMSGETIASLNQEQLNTLNNIYATMIGSNIGTGGKDIVKESYQNQSPVIQTIDIKPLSDKVNVLCDIVDEIRTRQVEGNMDRQTISENVGEIVKPIHQMRTDMSEVKQNTAKL